MGESGVCGLDGILGVTGLAGPVGSCLMSLPSSLNCNDTTVFFFCSFPYSYWNLLVPVAASGVVHRMQSNIRTRTYGC
jgi:hypothetical protein